MREEIRLKDEARRRSQRSPQISGAIGNRLESWAEGRGDDGRVFELDRSAGATHYLPVALNRTLLPKVGVFVPPSFRPAAEVTVVVYFHGLIHPCDAKGVDKFRRDGVEYYWNTPMFSFLREDFAASGADALLIVPNFLPLFGRKGDPSDNFGNLDRAGRLDFLVGECLSGLSARGALPKSAAARAIVVAGHSAGGLPLQSALAAKNALGRKIAECWGFESLYYGTSVIERWLAANPDKRFLHFRRPGKFVGATEKLKKQPNFVDFQDGRDHCRIVKQKWLAALKHCRVLHGTAAPPQTSAQKPPAPAKSDGAGAPPAESVLREWRLETKKIRIASAGSKKKGDYRELKEAPADFLPAIVRLAREKALAAGARETAAKLDPDRWFKQFTRIEFLGRPLKGGDHLHVEMARLLKEIEARFVRELGAGDAKKTGDILLNNSTEGISGSRLTSSTATFSMHMFGLAVDVNYLGNPYIEKGDVTAVNNVLANAAQLTNAEKLSYRRNDKGRFADRYDYVRALDDVIEGYFKLLDDPAELERRLRASRSDAWRTLPLAEAQKKIEKNLHNLAGYLARGKHKKYFKQHGILDFDKRFVAGMEKMRLHWGGWYGDMMHFDMRQAGVGLYIEKARNEYAAAAKRRAQQLPAG